jgi:hypothetical protein
MDALVQRDFSGKIGERKITMKHVNFNNQSDRKHIFSFIFINDGWGHVKCYCLCINMSI